MAERGFLHRLILRVIDWWFGRQQKKRDEAIDQKEEVEFEVESHTADDRQRTARRFVRKRP